MKSIHVNQTMSLSPDQIAAAAHDKRVPES